jgi:hypothetical protein
MCGLRSSSVILDLAVLLFPFQDYTLHAAALAQLVPNPIERSGPMVLDIRPLKYLADSVRTTTALKAADHQMPINMRSAAYNQQPCRQLCIGL